MLTDHEALIVSGLHFFYMHKWVQSFLLDIPTDVLLTGKKWVFYAVKKLCKNLIKSMNWMSIRNVGVPKNIRFLSFNQMIK